MKPVEAWAVVYADSGQLLSVDSVHGTEREARQEMALYEGVGRFDVRRVQISEGWRDIAEAPRDGTPVDLWATWLG